MARPLAPAYNQFEEQSQLTAKQSKRLQGLAAGLLIDTILDDDATNGGVNRRKTNNRRRMETALDAIV
jgi:hypothetical protein